MKKAFLILVALTAFFAYTQISLALTVTTGATLGPYQSGSGGEFSLLPSAPDLLAPYASSTKDVTGFPGTFQTFCVELKEYIAVNTTYNAIPNSNAVNGGVGPAGDPLSKGAAYLYFQFATGNLSSTLYNYAGTQAQRQSSAADLQNALWSLKDEGGGINAGYTTLLKGVFGSIANAKLDNNGLYNVNVLNLTLDGALAQDVLALGSGSTVPEPTTMILFGLGLIGLAGLRRKE